MPWPDANRAEWIGLGVLLGAVAGSFLATLAIRWGRDESVVRGRSRCDVCGALIPGWALIPAISIVLLEGRCRACAAPIDRRHLALELGCMAIGGASLAARPGAEGLAGALSGWLLAALALLDLDHFWLPDRLVAPLLLLGLAAGAYGIDPSLSDRIAGALLGFALLTIVGWSYRRIRGREGLGQGDAKLLAAIGAWLGWRALPDVVLLAALLGLGWTLLLAARGRTVSLVDRLPLGTLLALAAWPLWVAGI